MIRVINLQNIRIEINRISSRNSHQVQNSTVQVVQPRIIANRGRVSFRELRKHVSMDPKIFRIALFSVFKAASIVRQREPRAAEFRLRRFRCIPPLWNLRVRPIYISGERRERRRHRSLERSTIWLVGRERNNREKYESFSKSFQPDPAKLFSKWVLRPCEIEISVGFVNSFD